MSESEMRELLAAAEKVVDSCRDSDSAIARSIATVFRAILNSHAEQERKLARLESAEAVVRAAEEYRMSCCMCQNHLPPYCCGEDCERRCAGVALDAALAKHREAK